MPETNADSEQSGGEREDAARDVTPATPEAPDEPERPTPEVNPQRQPDTDPESKSQGRADKTAAGPDRTDI